MPQMSDEELARLREAMPKANMTANNAQSQSSTGAPAGSPAMSQQNAQAEYQRRMMEQQRMQQQQQMLQMQQRMQNQNAQAGGNPASAASSTVSPMDLSNMQKPAGQSQLAQQPQPAQQTQSAPQPNPGISAQQSGGTSAQQAMRARMMASRDQLNGQQQNVMQQGDTYNPGSANQQPAQQQSQEPIVPEQQNDIANNTIINTTDAVDQVSPEKKKKKALIGAAVGLVAIIGVILIFSVVSKNQPAEEPVDEWNEDDYDWVVPEEYYSYTTEQLDALREMGWTADEIEAAQTQQIPATTLIKQAKAARNAYVQMTLAPMYDTASYEYKHFIEQTWLTLPERDDMNDWNNIASYYQERKNLDYEKIDVYGKQLFIKVYLDDNLHEDWFFITVTPEEWNKLDDFGNIVINYTYVTRYLGDDIWTAEEDFEDYYITEASIEFTN